MASKKNTIPQNNNLKEREPYLYVAVGKKGVGKTYQTIKIIDSYVRGNAIYGIKPRKVLILDVNDEYTQYRKLSPSDIKRFAAHPVAEARRIVPYYKNGQVMELRDLEAVYKYATKHFRGGLLLAEDLTKFVGDNLPADIVGYMCTNRHRDVDMVVHFQGIGKAGNPKIKANMNILRLHPVLESVDKHKDKFNEYTEIIKIAQNIVNSRYTEFMRNHREQFRTYFDFFVYVNFDKNQIQGNFTRDEFEKIITEYIQKNEKTTIGELLKLKDRTGKKIYQYSEALAKEEQELFDKYAPSDFFKS